jgi:glycosyltransferase involved in cell wall biosynthesis
MMEIARALAHKHEVHVLTSGTSVSRTYEKHPELDLFVHRVRIFGRAERATATFLSMAAFLPLGIRRGSRLLTEQSFDVVNTWFAIPSGITGGVITRRRRVPHLLTIIGGDIYDPSKRTSPHHFFPAGLAAKWALRHADGVVAISSDIARRAHEYFGAPDNIEVIPLGIAEPTFRARNRAELGLSPERKYIVAVGRLVRRKDYPTLIQAVKLLDREDTSLLILGDGPERDNLRALANQLGIGDRVELRGFVSEEEKYQILCASDVFALASLHEGFGVVYLEAMYCGLPVIAANTGGQIDLLVDHKTGRLVPVSDAAALGQSLRDLLGDAALARQIGEFNRRRFQEFSVATLAARYEKAFERVRR